MSVTRSTNILFTTQRHTMNARARQTLNELRSLGNIERYLKTAKAELASSPCDERLRAFIDMVEQLLQEERAKLTPSPLRG